MMKQTDDKPERSNSHSKSYRKYFEGYSEYFETNAKGKQKLRRVYTGVYHTQRLTRGKWWAVRVIYCACWLLSAILYMFCVTRDLGSNLVWYVAVAEVLSFIGMCWFIWALYNYLSAGKNLTLGEYRYVNTLTQSARFAFAAEALTAAATLIYAFLHLQEVFTQELLCALGLLVSAVLSLAVFLIEKNIPYISFESQKEAPPGARQVTYDEE